MGKRGPQKGAIYKPTHDKARARQVQRDMIIAELGPLTQAQIDHAKGIKYLVARHKAGGKFEKVTAEQLDAILQGQDDGTTILEVWDKDPSVQAFTDLMNRALDKPADHVELTGAEGGPLVVKWQG